MSEAHVEMFRDAYQALNRALATGADLHPLTAGLAPDIVVEMGVLEGTFHGREGFVRFVEGQMALFDGLRCDPKEFIVVGDRVVVPIRLHGTVRSTGLPLDYHAVHVWTVRDGQATHLRLRATKETALRSLEEG